MLNLDNNHSAYQIRAYKPGTIQVNDQVYTRSIIVSAHELMDNWPPQTITELKQEHLNIILTLSPALLLIGTGESLVFPEIEIYGELINHDIGIEVMDTAAACRTFNALTSEDRNVVAALLIR
jgi:uncharacterized protein